MPCTSPYRPTTQRMFGNRRAPILGTSTRPRSHVGRFCIIRIYSTEVLEHILSHEDCDVDPVNHAEQGKTSPPPSQYRLRAAHTTSIVTICWMQALIRRAHYCTTDHTSEILMICIFSIKDKNRPTALVISPHETVTYRWRTWCRI